MQRGILSCRKKPEMEKVGKLQVGPPKHIRARARAIFVANVAIVANVADCGKCGRLWPLRNTTREIFAIKGLRDLKLPHEYRAIISYPMMPLLSAGVVGFDLPQQWVDTFVADCGECGGLWRMWPIVAPARSCACCESREF